MNFLSLIHKNIFTLTLTAMSTCKKVRILSKRRTRTYIHIHGVRIQISTLSYFHFNKIPV